MQQESFYTLDPFAICTLWNAWNQCNDIHQIPHTAWPPNHTPSQHLLNQTWHASLHSFTACAIPQVQWPQWQCTCHAQPITLWKNTYMLHSSQAVKLYPQQSIMMSTPATTTNHTQHHMIAHQPYYYTQSSTLTLIAPFPVQAQTLISTP